MTLTKDIAAKFAIAIVAVAMVLSAFAPVAKAQTTEDLQKMINDLLAQVAALQSQAGQEATSAAGVCPYTWTRDLNTGATGADVKMLQQFLNADADTRVAAEGVGSAGMETEFYGPATAAAVSKMQVKYRADILSPANLVNPTGYFGPSSRAKANALCAAAPVVDEDTEDEDATDEEDEDMELSGEGILDNVTVDSASDDEIEEGSEDAEIAEVTLEAVDGDIEISRMDIAIDGGATDAWDVLDTISLWIDGDKVAEMDASDEDEYQSDDVTLRFSGLDFVVAEDEEVEITVAATVQGSVDSADIVDPFDVSVDSIRYFDADGVAETDSNTGDLDSNVSFTIVEAGTDDELIVKTSSADPDAATLQVEDDQKSDWFTVFAFDLDTDESVNDIEITTVPVTVTVSSSTFDVLVDDAELVIDGTTIDDYTVATTATSTIVVLSFDVDGDVVIDAGERVAAELKLRFNSLALSNEGVTVAAEVSSTNADDIEAEGADDLDNTQTSGAADGEAHTLRTAGIDVSLESTDADATVVDGGSDYATYVIEVEVTAFEQDVYLDTDAAVSINYDLEDSAGSSTVAGTRSVVLESTGDETAGYFEITEGSTETLTLTVTYTPGVANTAARMVLDSIEFSDAAQAPDQIQTTLPATTYRTAVVTIVN